MSFSHVTIPRQGWIQESEMVVVRGLRAIHSKSKGAVQVGVYIEFLSKGGGGGGYAPSPPGQLF